MNKVLSVLKKIPADKALKGVGTIMVGAGSVLGCARTDKNVAKMLTVVAGKFVKKH